ncbi:MULTISPECIES: flagella synthesis protein FlgN [Erwinia]|uniref:Flagellar export chaperone FlgN n=1 Tax=Erwinia pyrifoliae TaxID=79967 RepID=A0ABY5XBM8_ERWPY|nr:MULTISPECIES: flagellar export chaperone FlgN [Erwinia]AUX73486.1 flagella synthesis protein [Erwinia pyrifoliae]MCA8876213.1 flagella synthesis protein [Erwinia pyrifoliae]MCT2386354.1 flagellar export chaperone FlgN [Erwinia pyrifoliae]MCU8588049.1 flagellar export chaperone FlgN [Erwinia pyrifoliae]UWS28450.1 flagellar export chaperone FlgN [Erwinia pyrifoliae]
MDKLYPILSQMKTSLGELEGIMIEEFNHLSRPQINPVSLQILTDNKSQLLSTIHYYDELRRKEEAEMHISAPYRQQVKLFTCWQQLSEKVESTKKLNLKVEELLNMHMKTNLQMKQIVTTVGGNNSLYGSTGESHSAPVGGSYRISV